MKGDKLGDLLRGIELFPGYCVMLMGRIQSKAPGRRDCWD